MSAQRNNTGAFTLLLFIDVKLLIILQKNTVYFKTHTKIYPILATDL
jgi:hypothetical protein